MTTIPVHCEGCGSIMQGNRSSEIPAHVVRTHCNWCSVCEDSHNEEWREWWNSDDPGVVEIPAPVPDNQLCLPFILEEIGIKSIQLTTHE